MEGLVVHVSDVAWSRVHRILMAVAVLSWLGCALGVASAPRQFYASYLVSFTYFLTIALGAAFFLMVWQLSGAVWSLPVRRLMETVMATLPLAPLLFLPVVAGIGSLYEWSHPEFISEDPVLQVKMAFFNRTFFLARAAVYLLVWSVLAVVLYRSSVSQDEDSSLRRVRRAVAWSGPGLAALMITVTMAAVDWLMSLEPHWYSTIFGIYIFAGGGLAFLAMLILLCQAFRRGGLLADAIQVNHYHDLGRWLFAMVVFWAYIGFCQYLLIWYANLPEETIWFKHRLEGNWSWVSAALLVFNFILPFLLLISRAAKRSPGLLGAASGLLLLMHYVDLHWVVMPTVHHHGFHLHWLDLATFLAVGSACGLVFWRLLRRRALIPIGDLRLTRALRHQTE
jgi:predicted secreted protein